jgi:type VI secretion system protein ImpM
MSAIFLFGKLPAHGDFVCRGMTAAQRDSMDDWLTAEMAGARTEFGEGFDEIYDAAPPWRFASAEEGRWSAGALAPSADAAGRRFPLLVGCRQLPGDQVLAAAAQCETTIYDAITGGWTADRVAEEAAGWTEEPKGMTLSAEGLWWVDGGEEAGIPPLIGRRPPRLLSALLRAAGEGQ